MSGRRLLDAAAVLNASRAVASKHLTYRRLQLDSYSRTSSLAKAVQSQTDRVTLTLRAASALAQRLNASNPQYSTHTNNAESSTRQGPIPSITSVEGGSEDCQDKQGLEQDHSYKRSEEDTAAEPVQLHDLGIKQEQARRHPLPDGSIIQAGAGVGKHAEKTEFDDASGSKHTSTGKDQASDEHPGDLTADHAEKLQRQAERQIPSQTAEPPPASYSDPVAFRASERQLQDLDAGQGQDLYYSPSINAGKGPSALPRAKAPKATEDVQIGVPQPLDEQINQDVFYSSTPTSEEDALPSAQAIPEQEEISDDVYSDIFQSPKVAKMMKGQPVHSQQSKVLDLKSTADLPSKKRKKATEKDHVIFNGRQSMQVDHQRSEDQDILSKKNSKHKSEEEETHELAQAMAKDAENTAEVVLILYQQS